MEITPQTIKEKVSQAAPFLADEVRSTFVGRQVSWELEFGSISNPTSGKYTVCCYTELIIPIIFEIEIEKFLEFKSLEKNSRVIVSGVIAEVDQISITLRDVEKIDFISNSFKKAESGDLVHEDIMETSEKVEAGNKDEFFLKQLIFHPAYSFLLAAVVVFLIYRLTDINLKDFSI